MTSGTTDYDEWVGMLMIDHSMIKDTIYARINLRHLDGVKRKREKIS